MADLPTDVRPGALARRTDLLLQPSRVLVVLTANVTLVGLLPCLGMVNWFVVPLCLGTIALGGAGLWLDRDAEGHLRRPGPYLAAIGTGGLLAALASVRLLLGFGLW